MHSVQSLESSRKGTLGVSLVRQKLRRNRWPFQIQICSKLGVKLTKKQLRSQKMAVKLSIILRALTRTPQHRTSELCQPSVQLIRRALSVSRVEKTSSFHPPLRWSRLWTQIWRYHPTQPQSARQNRWRVTLKPKIYLHLRKRRKLTLSIVDLTRLADQSWAVSQITLLTNLTLLSITSRSYRASPISRRRQAVARLRGMWAPRRQASLWAQSHLSKVLTKTHSQVSCHSTWLWITRQFRRRSRSQSKLLHLQVASTDATVIISANPPAC